MLLSASRMQEILHDTTTAVTTVVVSWRTSPRHNIAVLLDRNFLITVLLTHNTAGPTGTELPHNTPPYTHSTAGPRNFLITVLIIHTVGATGTSS